jgi:hypothetical protein
MHTGALLRLSGTIALSLAASPVCEAQTGTLRSGDRVRLTIPALTTSGALATGVVDPDTLRLTLKGRPSPLLVPWSSITRLSVSQPRTRRQGALNGLKWGLIIGAAVGAISLATPTPEGEDYDEGALAAEAVFDFAIVGTTIGALWPGRRWQRVNVADAREAVRLAMGQPVPAPAPVAVAPVSPRAGRTPAIELTAGSTAPGSKYAQFPGFAAVLAVNAPLKPRLGASLVAEAHGALFASSIKAGPRVYLRTAPLFARRRVVTFFAQMLAGSLRPERSGVVESTGGRALQPGGGIDFGSRSVAFRWQMDYTIVRNGFVNDDRTPGVHAEKLTASRVLVGVTLRSQGWRERQQ